MSRAWRSSCRCNISTSVTELRLIAKGQASGAELDFLIRGLSADEVGRDPEPVPQPFSFFLAEGDTLLGGLTGFDHAGGGFIDLFYVVPAHRGRGLGRRLIEAGAEHCRARGMAFLTVNTMDEAARDYYLARGFAVEFVRPGYVNGRALTYLRRDL